MTKYHSKESPVPRREKKLSQFSLLVKSPNVSIIANGSDPPFCVFFFSMAAVSELRAGSNSELLTWGFSFTKGKMGTLEIGCG